MTTDTLEKPNAGQHDVLIRGLFDRHGRALQRYVTRLLDGDGHAAADIVQETAVRAWRHADNLDIGGPEFRPWLLKVARRLVIDRHRQRQSRPVLVDADTPHTAVPVGDTTERSLSAMVVSDALMGLSPIHREVIRELYFYGRTASETAALLGIPVGTVKSRTHGALRALRNALAANGVETVGRYVGEITDRSRAIAR